MATGTATHASPWRAAITFAATSGVIAISFGVLARTSGLSLVMTCVMSLVVFAGGAQFLAVATLASGGTPLAAVLGGIVLNARHLPYGLAVAPLLRGPLWKRRCPARSCSTSRPRSRSRSPRPSWAGWRSMRAAARFSWPGTWAR